MTDQVSITRGQERGKIQRIHHRLSAKPLELLSRIFFLTSQSKSVYKRLISKPLGFQEKKNLKLKKPRNRSKRNRETFLFGLVERFALKTESFGLVEPSRWELGFFFVFFTN